MLLCRRSISPAARDRRRARFFALCTYGFACEMMASTCARRVQHCQTSTIPSCLRLINLANIM